MAPARTWAVEGKAWADAEIAANDFWDKKRVNRPDGGCFTWKQLTDAGETLVPRPVRGEDGRRGWILVGSRKWKTDKDFMEAREILKSSSKNFPFKMITEEDVRIFHILVREAKQEHEFHYNYVTTNARYDIIKPGSSVSDVIEKIPPEEIDCIPKIQLHCLIEYLIWSVNSLKKSQSDLDFAFSLPDLVEKTIPIYDNLEKLKQNDYVKNSEMSIDKLRYMLEGYWTCMFTSRMSSLYSYRRDIESKRKFIWENAKARDTYQRLDVNPVQFLVYLEREWKYAIQHPVVEIAKLSAYFCPFELEDPLLDPLLDDSEDEWAEDPLLDDSGDESDD